MTLLPERGIMSTPGNDIRPIDHSEIDRPSGRSDRRGQRAAFVAIAAAELATQPHHAWLDRDISARKALGASLSQRARLVLVKTPLL
jgi:hypothetical protein